MAPTVTPQEDALLEQLEQLDRARALAGLIQAIANKQLEDGGGEDGELWEGLRVLGQDIGGACSDVHEYLDNRKGGAR